MNFVSMLDAALVSLAANKGRTALTSLGITIGIAAVIAMVSAGQGAKDELDSALGTIGPNLVFARSGSQTSSGLRVGGGGVFTVEDAGAIRERLGQLINGVTPINQFPARASSKYGDSNETFLTGGVPEVFRIRRWKFRSGRSYDDLHVKRQDKVAVLGASVAKDLFPNMDPVGQTFRAAGQRFRVVGLLEPKGYSIIGADQDNVIMIPITTLNRKVMGTDKCMMIVAESRSTELVPEVQRRMEAMLRQRHEIGPDEDADFTVNNVRDMASIALLITDTLSWLIYAIASVSLLVGGIGVMNIMLVSVTERTREIGIRMAVGAKTRDVLGQFLLEAVMLALIGGGVGIAVGAGMAFGISRVADWHFVVTPESVAVAVATSAGVGIFFGYYPARKASLLDPIEALRYE